MKTRIVGHLIAVGVLCTATSFGQGLNDGKLGGDNDGKLTVPKPVERPAMFDPRIAEFYNQAVVLTRNRHYDEAEALCRRILAIKTNELNTVQLLREIGDRRLRAPAYDPSGALKRKLDEIVLPEFKTVEAVARDAVAFLQEQSGKYTADRTPVNFVWKVPASQKVPPVTLSLYKVSLGDVLQYITEASGLTLRYDENAVVVISKTDSQGPVVVEDNAQKSAGSALKRKLRDTILPEFHLANIPAREAMTQLQTEGGKAAVDRTPVNIVWNADQPVPTLALSLYKIPMADALRYLAELSGVRYRVDERAVVILAGESQVTAATTTP